jgi:hypothetical protein
VESKSVMPKCLGTITELSEETGILEAAMFTCVKKIACVELWATRILRL